jgi:hypothetical protein
MVITTSCGTSAHLPRATCSSPTRTSLHAPDSSCMTQIARRVSVRLPDSPRQSPAGGAALATRRPHHQFVPHRADSSDTSLSIYVRPSGGLRIAGTVTMMLRTELSAHCGAPRNTVSHSMITNTQQFS